MTEQAKSRRPRGEGGLSSYETKAGKRWSIVYTAYDPQRGQRRQFRQRGFSSEAAARKALRRKLQEVEDGGHVAPSQLTLTTFLQDRWLPAVRGEVRPSTYDSYSRNLRLHVQPTLGGLPLQRIDAGQIQALYAQLQAGGRQDHLNGSGLSVRSVRYVHTILKAALQAAVEWELLRSNPAAKAKPPKQTAVTGQTMHTWSRDQVRGFLGSAASNRLYPLWLLLLTTGMRRGEALGLCWDSVDLDAGRLRIVRSLVDLSGPAPASEPVWSDPKTRKGVRSVALDSATVAALRARRSAAAQDRLAVGAGWHDAAADFGGLVFTLADGRPLHPERTSALFQSAARRAKLPVIRLHDLRHTWATLALEAGVHPKVVSERLGHANIGITLDTYSHVSQAIASDAAEQVARLFVGEAQ